MSNKTYQSCFKSLLFILALLAINLSRGYSQNSGNSERIYFISDVQAPLPVEKIILKSYRNTEARDSLFADILRQHPQNLFMLGDLTSMGSKEKTWTPLDSLLSSLNKMDTKAYAIPGNHEYMGRSNKGVQMFTKRFPQKWLYGYYVNIDSIAIVMLNSNFNKLSKNELSQQLLWYSVTMDSLDSNPSVRAIIVCTHHAPYSNSKIVGSSTDVTDLIVPVFEKSHKAKLFISGHSHNLEYFTDSIGKQFLVIGGGGGLTQPLQPMNERLYTDLLSQDIKPLYFYLVIEKQANSLKLIAKGFKKDFRFFEIPIGTVLIN